MIHSKLRVYIVALHRDFHNPFDANVNFPFLYSLKTLENIWFYDLFRGWNGLRRLITIVKLGERKNDDCYD